MRGGAQSQQIDDQRLVIACPPITQKTFFGLPAMAYRSLPVLHPLPINAPVKFIGESADFRFLLRLVLIVSPCDEHAGDQEGSVDAGRSEERRVGKEWRSRWGPDQ